MSGKESDLQWIIHVSCPKSSILWGALLLMLSIISVMNGAIIFILFPKRRLLSVGTTLILHLAIADFLLSATTLPQGIAVLLRSPLASSYLCQLTAFFNRFTHCTAIYLMTTLAACRCYGVIKPLMYRIHIRKSRVNRVCLTAWLFSFIFALLPLFGWGEYAILHGECLCTLDTHKYPYQWLVISVLFFLLPSIINTVMFLCTAKSFNNKNKKSAVLRSGESHGSYTLSSILGRKRKVTIISSKKTREIVESKKANPRTYSFELRRLKTSVLPSSVADNIIEHVESETAVSKNSNKAETDKNVGQPIVIEVVVDVHPDNTNVSNICQLENKAKTLEKPFDINPVNCEQLQKHNEDHPSKSKDNPKNITGKVKIQHLESDPNIIHNDAKESNSVESEATSDKTGGTSKESKQSTRKQKKKSFKIFIVLLLFASFEIFCGPVFCVRLYYLIKDIPVPPNASKIAQTLNAFNSFINPFLYAFLNKDIRRNLRNIFCC